MKKQYFAPKSDINVMPNQNLMIGSNGGVTTEHSQTGGMVGDAPMRKISTMYI